MKVILWIVAIIFLIGLVSEQITSLTYQGAKVERGNGEKLSARND